MLTRNNQRITNPFVRLLMYIAFFTLPFSPNIYRDSPEDPVVKDRTLTLLLGFIRLFFWLTVLLNGTAWYLCFYKK